MKPTNELFLSSYQNYLTLTIESSFQQTDEVRIISQSMMPSDVLAIFLFIQQSYPHSEQLKSYLKVASGLIKHWETLSLDIADKEALVQLEANGWLDREDKLTWFRNRTTKDENVEKLLIFLVGIDYTTDKGGLADFFVVNDEKIWDSIGGNYKLWLKQAIEEKGKLVSDKTTTPLNDYLIQINKALPMSLSQKSEFIERWLYDMNNLTTDEELIISLFKLLPEYNLPYLSIENDLKDFRAKKGLKYLADTTTFISHTNYKSPSRKKSDYQKIEKAFTNDSPISLYDREGNEIDPTEYLKTVKDFIFNASKEAKDALVKVNLLPVLKALNLKEELGGEKDKSNKIFTYDTFSLQAILSGINDAIENYQKGNNSNSIKNIHIRLEHFQHDFSHSESEDLTRESLAISVLNGVLGGIDSLISSLKLSEQVNIRFMPIMIEGKPNFKLTTSSSKPQVTFEVAIEGDETEIYPFKWRLSEYQIERLHIQLAKSILVKLKTKEVCLPIIEIPPHIFKAIYYASSTEEACRLLSLGLDAIEIRDVFENHPMQQHVELGNKLEQLNQYYQAVLQSVLIVGRYASKDKMEAFYKQYIEVADYLKSLDGQIAKELIQRYYYAFFMLEHVDYFNTRNIEQVIVNGFHPAMLELLIAQTDFVIQAVENKYQENSNSMFEAQNTDDIFIQSEIESPILTLKQLQGITTHSKSFDWLHFIGKQPQGEIDLYVQSLLQENDQEFDEEAQTIELSTPEQDIIVNVLDDYQRVNNHANDGLRILATNVTQLPALLTGLNRYFDKILLATKVVSDFYSLQLTVYTNHLSKLATINTLKNFQNSLIELFAKKDKILKIKISHFMSSPTSLNNDLKNLSNKQQDTHFGLYDIAFNFNFLESKANGSIDIAPTLSEELTNKSQIFPIIYYPKPIFKQYENTRDLRLSQRQIKVQSCHTYLTTALYSPKVDKDEQYFVLSKMEYEPKDIEVIERLHEVAQWVVNIDEYFDHYLLKKSNNQDFEQKWKVISFSSGYGNYGELNVTLSTAHHAFERLRKNVESHLSSIMPYLHKPLLPQLANEILTLNEGLSGVANIKSILGDSETIRNLYGYALTLKYFKPVNNTVLSEWIPLDAYPHWFKGVDRRPDLLQLSVKINESNHPIIHAHLVESKIGSMALVNEAENQLEVGLKHLIKLFAPRSDKQSYDRRYWWGQMYRALITRAIVEQLNTTEFSIALEKLTEGDFDIHWSSSVVICKVGYNDETIDKTERQYLSDSLIGTQKSFHIYEFSEIAFEKTLLNWVDWSQVSREIQKPEPILLQPVQPITPPNNPEQLGFVELFDNTKETNSKTPETGQSGESPAVKTDMHQKNSTDSGSVTSTQATSEPIVTPQITDNTLQSSELNKPLLTGTINSTQQTESPNLDSKILIGQSAVGKTSLPYYWEYNHPMLNNRHMLIFGSSGSGKTYAIQCILSELANAGVSSFIIDYTDGFLKHQSQSIYQQVCQPKEYFVVVDRLPINPFKSYSMELMPNVVVNEKPFQVAIRVKNILSSVYNDFGSQQVAIIDKVLEEGLTDNPNYRLEDFLVDLEESGSRGESVANKIRTLVRLEAFDTSAENNIYEEEVRNQHAVQIIQLTQIPKDLQRIITEFVLWDLWAYVQKHGHKDKPITIVLDEMQNLDHRPDSPIDKLLREGRKFGISLILATQTISNFNQEQKDRLFQASTKLFFKPATTEVDSFASLLNKVYPNLSKADWVDQLNGLNKGQCFFIGYINDGRGGFKENVVKLNINSLEERKFIDYFL